MARTPDSTVPARRLGEILLSLGLIDSRALARALALQAGIPYLTEAELVVAEELRELVPKELARRLRVLPIRRMPDGAILVALEDPTGPDRTAPLSIVLDTTIVSAVAAPEDLDLALERGWPALRPAAPPTPPPVPAVPVQAYQAPTPAPPIPPPMATPLPPLSALTSGQGRGPTTGPQSGPPGPLPSVAYPTRPGNTEGTTSRPSLGALPAVAQNTGSMRAIPSVGTGGLDRIDLNESDLAEAAPRLATLRADAEAAVVLPALIAFALTQDALGIEIVPDGGEARLRLFAEGAWEAGPPLPRQILETLRSIDTPLPLRAPGARGRFLPNGRRGRPWGGHVVFPSGPLPLERFGLLAADLRRLRQWAVAREGLILVSGSPGSGRTTMLLSLATALLGGRTGAWIGRTPPPMPPGLLGIEVDAEGGSAGAVEAALRRDARVIFADDLRPDGLLPVISCGSDGLLVIASLAGSSAGDAMESLRETVADGWLGPQLLGVLELLSVRVLCPNCRTRGVTPKEPAEVLGIPPEALPPVSWGEGPGCAACRWRAWQGKRVVANRIELQAGIPEGSSDEDVRAEFDRGRSHRWVELAATLVSQGITSFAEVQRALLDDDMSERTARVSATAAGWRGSTAEDTVDGAGAPVESTQSFDGLDDGIEELEPIDAEPDPVAAPVPVQRVPTLLVIDASSEAARRIDRTVPEGEVRLISVRTVEEALAKVAAERPDALVLRALGDAAATAPRMRRFREDPLTHGIPIIIVTKETAGAKEFIQKGAAVVITSVMDSASVRDAVRKLVHPG